MRQLWDLDAQSVNVLYGAALNTCQVSSRRSGRLAARNGWM
jgi:hypothetical protein